MEDHDRQHSKLLLRSLAVAGFAAGNVMLLSVSVWSGAESATRDLLHWISALIALPAVLYAGQPFFRSAAKALTHWQLNMDVPISLAVVLAAAMSLYETATGGAHAYFDAAVMLLFFLLAGRTLDHMMRIRAKSALTGLVALQATSATVVAEDGKHRQLPIDQVTPGMKVAVAAGETVPVDGTICEGRSDLDRAIVTGESTPEVIEPGSQVEAGTTNLTGPVILTVSAVGEQTILAEIVRLMNAAERGRAGYVLLADRAARIYAPLVHLAAALAFLAWLWMSSDWHFALLTAISVLIITCPCALGLAVPAVQVVASGKLYGNGILVKDGAALERLAEIDTVVFDKTGTITSGEPQLAAMDAMPSEHLSVAAGIARASTHPLSKALYRHAADRGVEIAAVQDIREVPGYGMSGVWQGQTVRLGSRAWCEADDDGTGTGPELCLRIAGAGARVFRFEDQIRPGAAEAIEALHKHGLKTFLLSGDRQASVNNVALQTGIQQALAEHKPADKAGFIQALQESGRKVLMVGDGINDAPALGAAHASMAPSSAADVSGNSAGVLFLGNSLEAVSQAYTTAKTARRLVHQNFAFAAAYNAVAVPVAIAGLASPLVAAIAMSSSSIVVTLNALRLRLMNG